MADAFMAKGDQESASRYFKQAVAVTPEMVAAVMQQLDRLSIPNFVMLSDADGFAPFLFGENKIDLFVSQDSDSLPNGCENVFFLLLFLFLFFFLIVIN
jgi:5'-3' exonuclease